ncbi:Phosphoglucosamine mutase [subsurface metagenome]
MTPEPIATAFFTTDERLYSHHFGGNILKAHRHLVDRHIIYLAQAVKHTSGRYRLDLMVKTGKTPSQLLDWLFSKVGPHYYQRIDVEFPAEERQAITNRLRDNSPDVIDGVKVVKTDTADGFRFVLADTSWLLIRFSGTEPVLRIYTESNSQARVDRLLEFGIELAGV